MSLVVTIDVEYPERPGPDPLRVLDELLAVIDRHAVPVTFLVQGRWAVAHPDRVRDLVRRDPTLGLHGYAHVDYRRLNPEGVRAELRQGVAALKAAVPEHPVRWTRLPYGWAATDPAVVPLLAEAGLTPLGWDRSSFDWDTTLPDADALARVLPAAHEGGVVLFHSWPARSPWLVDQLLTAAGASVRRLSEVDLPGRAPQGVKLHPGWVDLPR
jgi:peptidoglycan/xylan/chitin deacetylase (PgdA/CDA1 family)